MVSPFKLFFTRLDITNTSGTRNIHIISFFSMFLNIDSNKYLSFMKTRASVQNFNRNFSLKYNRLCSKFSKDIVEPPQIHLTIPIVLTFLPCYLLKNSFFSLAGKNWFFGLAPVLQGPDSIEIFSMIRFING